MKNEENVDVETTLAEKVAVAKESAGSAEEEVSTVLGKFKDVNALARAYEALEAEFTRRSQRLRALEREVENSKDPSGAEKLRKTAKARREATRAFDAFVAAVDAAAKQEEPTEQEAMPSPELLATVAEREDVEEGKEQGVKEVEENTALLREKVDPSPSETLFQRAQADENVRLRIVGEYLASLGKQAVPLTAAGAGVLATPPRKAKTVGQAGDMALLYFRKPTVD